ncbi:MAG TPA: flagellar basal body rod protein FlgB [Oscillospiraceae bacterium]|nr:flagellar basal body rod protein FlgB [Oscillospiraceae bacterium]
MNWLDSVSLNAMNKDLDGLWARQQAISNNLANYETPGYKAKTVSFEDQLQAQLSNKSATEKETVNNIKSIKPITVEHADETFRLDGNGVDLEAENIEMARTQYNYMYTLRALTDSFARLKTVINGNGT